MKKNTLIIAGIILSVLLVGLTLVTILLFGRHPQTKPISPTVEPSPTPSVEAEAESPEEGAKEKQIAAHVQQPLIKALPVVTHYWQLDYRGSRDNKLQVLATVFVKPGESADAAIERQKRYIVDFIKRTGQPYGTYVITYTTGHSDNY